MKGKPYQLTYRMFRNLKRERGAEPADATIEQCYHPRRGLEQRRIKLSFLQFGQFGRKIGNGKQDVHIFNELFDARHTLVIVDTQSIHRGVE